MTFKGKFGNLILIKVLQDNTFGTFYVGIIKKTVIGFDCYLSESYYAEVANPVCYPGIYAELYS